MTMLSRWRGRSSNGGSREMRRREMDEPSEMLAEMTRPLMKMQRELNRVFDDFFEGGSMMRRPSMLTDTMPFEPRMDLSETADEFKITADVPGMSEDDIDITVSDDTLIINGERSESTEEEEENYFRRERSYGMFHRRVPLPDNVERDNIDAIFKNGVLTINVPKTEEARSNWRKIEVKSE